jgi:hypothetical protein
MKVRIDIECDDTTELLSHLSAIRAEAKRQLKGIDEPEKEIEWTDNNCYSIHHLTITPKLIEDESE